MLLYDELLRFAVETPVNWRRGPAERGLKAGGSP